MHLSNLSTMSKMRQGKFLSRVQLIFNFKVFLHLDYLPIHANHSLRGEKKKKGRFIHAFPRVLSPNENQTALSRVWTGC